MDADCPKCTRRPGDPDERSNRRLADPRVGDRRSARIETILDALTLLSLGFLLRGMEIVGGLLAATPLVMFVASRGRIS